MTCWATPLVTAVLIVLVVPCPAVTVAELGEAAIEKSFEGAAVTVRENVVLWVAVAPVPVTVIGVGPPAGVDVDVVTVIVELWPELITVGLNETVVPLGAPEAVSVTCWATPLVMVVFNVVVVPAPAGTLADAGEAVIEKSLAGGGVVAPALNSATPADQYIPAGKLPPKLCALIDPSVWYPLSTLTVLGFVDVTCGWVV